MSTWNGSPQRELTTNPLSGKFGADQIGKAIDAGFQHIVLGLPAPYPANVAQWVTDELITTSA